MWNKDLYKIGIVLDINEIEDYHKVFLFDMRLLLQENKPREELLEEQSVFILPLLTSCDRAIGHALIGNLFHLVLNTVLRTMIREFHRPLSNFEVDASPIFLFHFGAKPFIATGPSLPSVFLSSAKDDTSLTHHFCFISKW